MWQEMLGTDKILLESGKYVSYDYVNFSGTHTDTQIHFLSFKSNQMCSRENSNTVLCLSTEHIKRETETDR